MVMEDRHFTLPEARNMLPWLESKFTELDPYRAEIAKCQKRVNELQGMSRSNGHSHLEVELQRLYEMAQVLQKSVEDILSQIQGRGIIVRDLEKGLVDFPSLRQTRTVHLCWLRGEADISHWHETDAGFGGRQPL